MPPQSSETWGILLASSSHAIAFHAFRWFLVLMILLFLPVLGIVSIVPMLTHQLSVKYLQLMGSLVGALVLSYFYLVATLFIYGTRQNSESDQEMQGLDSANGPETKTVFVMGASTRTISVSSPEACALDKNRRLKDASEIDWYEDGDDATPMVAAGPSTERSGRGQRKKNTKRLKASITKGKKKAVKDGAGSGEESGSDYADTSGLEESDLESEVEIPNDELADSLSSKTLPQGSSHTKKPPQKKRKSTNTPVTHGDHDKMTNPVIGKDTEPQASPTDNSHKTNLIYHFYEIWPTNAHGEPGLITHLKRHAPAMYQLYEIMKSCSDPPTEEEIQIASAQKVLDPKAAARYLEKLSKASGDLDAAFTCEAVQAAGAWDQKKFETLLIEWIIACDQPFEEVKCPEFRRLLEYTHHPSLSLHIPSADTIQWKIMKMRDELTKSLRVFFKLLEGIGAISKGDGQKAKESRMASYQDSISAPLNAAHDEEAALFDEVESDSDEVDELDSWNRLSGIQTVVSKILGRAFKYHNTVDQFVAINKDLHALELSNEDWEAISMDDIKKIIATLPMSTPPELKQGLLDAHRKLSNYYYKYDESPFYTWAALLDPRILYTKGLKRDYKNDLDLDTLTLLCHPPDHQDQGKLKMSLNTISHSQKRIFGPQIPSIGGIFVAMISLDFHALLMIYCQFLHRLCLVQNAVEELLANDEEEENFAP
ncbi:uncharacterized protein EV420DRAFT_1487276 [Desarmillaria tabescens]|uniref:Uncharacterized protein n=1 Tax=Armillaria tabescens TaxID=1929756 RepID=A0AA39MKU2_ARMTA|nr:uncharacterized protein EV420DRAFT_1487276 [Desarmillaria tabescens]KAK0437090.1 hypothetical protein EV420DRAFT_1487276 [Desarmillaria tabescens]